MPDLLLIGTILLAAIAIARCVALGRTLGRERQAAMLQGMLVDNLVEIVCRHRALHPDLNAMARLWEREPPAGFEQ